MAKKLMCLEQGAQELGGNKGQQHKRLQTQVWCHDGDSCLGKREELFQQGCVLIVFVWRGYWSVGRILVVWRPDGKKDVAIV